MKLVGILITTYRKDYQFYIMYLIQIIRDKALLSG